MSELTAAQRVKIARTLGRPGTLDFVNALFHVQKQAEENPS